MSEIDLQVKDLKFLPQTRAFVDSYNPKASKWFLVCVCFLLFVFFVWAVFAPMDDVEIASAILRPVDNISSLNIAVSGEVVKKNYTQNQKVSKGDLLLLQLDASAQDYELRTTRYQTSSYKRELGEYTTLLSFIENDSLPDNLNQLNETYSTYITNYISEYKQFALRA